MRVAFIFGDADLDSGGAIPSRREVTLAAGTEISLAFTDINLETEPLETGSRQQY